MRSLYFSATFLALLTTMGIDCAQIRSTEFIRICEALHVAYLLDEENTKETADALNLLRSMQKQPSIICHVTKTIVSENTHCQCNDSKGYSCPTQKVHQQFISDALGIRAPAFS